MQVIATDLREPGKRSINHALRREGRIPAVYYGRSVPHRTLWIDGRQLKEHIRQNGAHALFQISIGGGEPQMVIAKEIQRNPLKQDEILHVDLYHVEAGQPVDTVLPLEFSGEPKGVRQGGVLQVQLRELEVRALPQDLPQALEVSIEQVDIGDVIYVRDLPVPERIEVLSDPDELVLTVLEVRKGEEEESPAAAEATADLS